jgi:hypothetical protein
MLISPSITWFEIAALLTINVISYGIVGFLATKFLTRPGAYFTLLAAVLIILLLANGGFVWVALTALFAADAGMSMRDALGALHIPSFLIVAGLVVAIFLIRLHRARRFLPSRIQGSAVP